jgi:hypothetical protein
VTLLDLEIAKWGAAHYTHKPKKLARAWSELLGVLGLVLEDLGMADPSQAEGTAFRRLFREHDILCLEAGPGQLYWLPGRYNVEEVFKRVKAAGRVDLSRWRSFNSTGETEK